jgi:hypothetical protein
MTAYKCRTEEIARIMSYAQMGNIRIIAVLNRHFNVTPTEAFMTVLDRAIRNKNLTNAQMEVLRLKCILLGYKNVPPQVHQLAVPPEIAEATKEKRKANRKPRTPAKPSKSDMVREAENVRF